MIRELTEAIIKQVYDDTAFQLSDGGLNFNAKVIIKLCELILELQAKSLVNKDDPKA